MNENQYRNGVPLQPNNRGLIISASEVVHIFGQLKSLPKASGNSSTFTLGPIPYVGGHRKGSFSSINVVCHPVVGGEEEEATLDPTYTVRRALLIGSRITTTVMVGDEGVLGVSSSLLKGWLVWKGLLRLRGARRGCSLS